MSWIKTTQNSSSAGGITLLSSVNIHDDVGRALFERVEK
jgi:hypothetical protein